jgi:hypothetical protein
MSRCISLTDALCMQAFDEAREWPFEGLSEGLAHDLFDAQWEVRHGAAAALREILRVHGRGAGKGVAAMLLDCGGVGQGFGPFNCRPQFGSYVAYFASPTVTGV